MKHRRFYIQLFKIHSTLSLNTCESCTPQHISHLQGIVILGLDTL